MRLRLAPVCTVHMAVREREVGGDAPLRCVKCGDRIGVYEPLVHIDGGVARRTSRAAEPEIVHARPVYHAACWELGGTPSGPVD
jgi:hypothetical protein